jgi:hypothetical protein
MKKIIFIFLTIFCFSGCIKKKALKYDPDLVGTWIAKEEKNRQIWIVVYPDGKGTYRVYESPASDERPSGTVKYSAFELKMWIGGTKFKVKEWLTADMKGTNAVTAKDYETLQLKTYLVDRRMVLKTSILNGLEWITFYRIAQ